MKLARKLEVWLHVVNTDECTWIKMMNIMQALSLLRDFDTKAKYRRRAQSISALTLAGPMTRKDCS